MESEIDFAPLLLVSALAFLIPLATHRLSGGTIPSVVGEIGAGIIFGQTLLGVIEPNAWLEFLSLFGFAYLMFLSGLEVDIGLLTRPLGGAWYKPLAVLKHPLVAGTGLLALILVATALVLWGLNEWGQINDFALLLFVLSATSVGVMVPVLKLRQESGAYGQTLLVAGFLVEFVAIVAIGIIVAIDREGLGLEAALLLALPGAFAALLLLARQSRRRLPQFVALLTELAHASSQIQIRGALALLVVFVVLSQVVGTELVLGAFFAGLALTILTPRQGSSMRVKLDALGYGFFIPVFFITAGASIDLEAVTRAGSSTILIPAVLGAGIVVKALPALLTLSPGFGLRRSLAGGMLLTANLSIILAATTVAVETERIDEGTSAVLLILAIVSTALAPIAFNFFYPTVRMEKISRAIVVGAGATGSEMARRLLHSGLAVTVIDITAKALAPLAAIGCETMTGDARDPSIIGRAAPRYAELAVIAISDPDLAYGSALALRQHNADLRIVTLVRDPDPRLESLDVEVHRMGTAAALTLEGAVLRPSLFFALGGGSYGALEEVVLRDPELAERPLFDLELPGSVRVILILRDGSLIIPEGDSELRLEDRVTLGGEPAAVREAYRMFSGRDLEPPRLAAAGLTDTPPPVNRTVPDSAIERVENEANQQQH